MKRVVLIALLASASAAYAAPFGDLFKTMQAAQLEENRELQDRLAHFRKAAQERQALLKQVQTQMRAEEKRSNAMEQAFRKAEKDIEKQRQKLDELTAHYKEVFATAKLWAADLKGRFEHSLVSAQLPERLEPIGLLAKDDHVFTVDDMGHLPHAALIEARQQGQVVRFRAQAAAPDGTPIDLDVVRVGIFTATAGDRFLGQAPDSTDLLVLPRQPRATFRSIAEELADADAEQTSPLAVIDPSRGAILTLMMDSPNMMERIDQGGVIGYLIIVIGIFGVLLALVRGGLLGLHLKRIMRQHHDLSHPSADNALGRIALVYHEHRDTMDPEALEERVSEAVSDEVPKLNWGLNLLRVLAAVAPLLGLLGTVTGMIQTFQDITLFGTGDPRMMAGGISQALVTTALGLTAAIPILLLLTVVRSYSTRIRQIVEEQSLGLLTRALKS